MWLVYEYQDSLESIWSSESLAKKRHAELKEKNGGEYGWIEEWKIDTPAGFLDVVN